VGVAVLPRVVAVRIEVLELFFVGFVPHRHFDFWMQVVWFVVVDLFWGLEIGDLAVVRLLVVVLLSCWGLASRLPLHHLYFSSCTIYV
jgi:hypothetical protein